MPRKNGEPLDPMPPSNDEFWDGDKYSIEIKPSEHKCKFTKISSTEIRCNCGKGYSGSNIDFLLEAFDNRS